MWNSQASGDLNPRHMQSGHVSREPRNWDPESHLHSISSYLHSTGFSWLGHSNWIISFPLTARMPIFDPHASLLLSYFLFIDKNLLC